MLEKIVKKIESFEITFQTWLFSLFSIIALRIGLESFSAKKGELFTFLTFPHFYFFFFAAILSLILIMRLFTKESVIKISKIALIGWFVSLVSPIVDLFFSKGKGDVVIAYLLTDNLNDLIRKYFTFFGSSLEYGMTYGIRVQTILACFLVGLYVYLKTKNPIKTVLSALTVYTTIYFFAVLPSLLTIAHKWSLDFSKAALIDTLFLPQKIYQLSLINPNSHFDFKLVLILIPITITLLLLWFHAYDKKAFKAYFKNCRSLRFVISAMSLFLGLYLALRITGNEFENNFFSYLTLLNLLMVPFFLWLYSIGQNDIHDLKIDQETNRKRPLVSKALTVNELKIIKLLALIIANGAAFNLGLRFFTLSLILSALTYLYSTPPLRLRRFPFVSSIIISFSIVLTLFLGFMLAFENQSLAHFPRNIILTTILLFTLVTNVKDIKDFQGDKKGNVVTIITFFGKRKGKFVLGILNFIAFPISAALLTKTSALLFISIGFGLIAFFLTYDKKTKEFPLFVLYSLFFLVLLVFTY